jgi:hypothetical protein
VLETSLLGQLAALVLLAAILFFVASALPQRVATTIVMLMVPFQAVESFAGTSTMLLAYVVFVALLVRGERVQVPMLGSFMVLLAWYLVSMSLQHPSTYSQHAVYIYTLVSAFLVFWLCHDLTKRFDRPNSIINVFIWMNILVVVYCLIQLWIGPGERFKLFGLSEISMTRVRADGRLTGPFESAEITAQYFVIMVFVIVHQFWYSADAWVRRGLILLIAVNLALLIATASRGEFLLLIGGSGLYLWLFRRRLGPMRAMGLALTGGAVLVASSLVIVTFTPFGDLFNRLQRTEIEAGVPDTRAVVWPAAWHEIKKNPIIGHGPRLKFFMEDRGKVYPNHTFIQFPHSLYLYLLFTVGIPGLLLFLWVQWRVLVRCWRRMSRLAGEDYAGDLARTGVLIILLFLIDGIKIEQTRLSLADYWHFWFGLLGVLWASTGHTDAQPADEQDVVIPAARISDGQPGVR